MSQNEPQSSSQLSHDVQQFLIYAELGILSPTQALRIGHALQHCDNGKAIELWEQAQQQDSWENPLNG